MSNRKIPELTGTCSTGLYRNIYKDKITGEIIVSERWYEYPHSAEARIKWHDTTMEYLYTAQVISGIHKFEKP